TQRIRVVLVLVAAGQLEDALAHQGFQAVAGTRRIRAPVREAPSERRADSEVCLGFSEPGQTPSGGPATTVKGRRERSIRAGGKGKGCCGRMDHARASVGRSSR